MSQAINPSIAANALYAVLAWEPVHGSGEKLNVGALIQYEDKIQSRVLIREDVLRCMYGMAGESAFGMIASSLKAIENVANTFGVEAALESLPVASLCFGSLNKTWSDGEHDLLRQIVLMHSSLSSLPEEPITTSDDAPTPEREVNQQWTTKVKEAIQLRRPDLAACFNRELVLVEGSAPVKFPFLTSRFVAQFGLLKVNSQSAGMEDARAKMWKLALARERDTGLTAAMVVGTPPLDDVTLSERSQARFVANVSDLEREARKYNITLHTAQSVVKAADFVIEQA